MTPKDMDLTRWIGEPMTCLVREAEKSGGGFDVLSPAVGRFDKPPAIGTYVQPGSFAGYLHVLRRYFHLLIPEGRHGIVTDLFLTERRQRVEYGQALYRVSSDPASSTAETAAREIGRNVEEAGIPQGMFALKSPTDGIFYRRPNPRSPPYTEEGSKVVRGVVLALVEVMKCFNPIVYPGEPEYPAQARIRRIVPTDASEVKHGSILFVFESV